jgi:beta-lactamase class A
MQSVFKFPLALAVLHQVERGTLSLNEAIRFQPGDRILPQTHSPLQDEHPNANADVSIEELLRLAVSFSDNVAADILLRTIGGPKAVSDYVASLGVAGFHLEDDEHALHREPSLQYRNWFTPDGAVALLRILSDKSPLSPAHTALILEWMQTSVRSRLGAGLPANALVAHKAGTSGVVAGLAAATNDVGLITMPDGRRLAVAVFITDSQANEAEREQVISRIAKEVYEGALQAVEQPPTPGVTAEGLEDLAYRLLRETNAAGFVHVRDVISGRVLVHAGTSAEGTPSPDLAINSPVPLLSVIKVYVAAAWLEHGFGDIVVDCSPSATRPLRRMLVEEVLASGCDSAGTEMAVTMRRRLGADRVLRDLRRYGLRGLKLNPDASDTEWGQVLSLGEDKVPVTPEQLSGFLRRVNQGDGRLVSNATARRLRSALEGVVQNGTASPIKDFLSQTRWRIGGKTGTGPGQCDDHCDGWFAGILSDENRVRYVIMAYIRGKGLGGGVAARTAASIARYLAAQQAAAKNRLRYW